ncbi:MAG: class I SAM-dependent rRNA methyltransferase [Clostridia bacterium]|nr:class I SAM-dependent rRNA methyltransferase [Clostridia bacterium]
MAREYPIVTVNEKAEKRVRAGHPWVYGDDLIGISGELADGGLADVRSEKGKLLGTAFYNSASKIRLRVVSTNANDKFDEKFWRRRIAYALDYRKTVMGTDFDCSRLIFGEADGLPGMTADLFGTVLVTEIACKGIDMLKEMLYRLLREELAVRGVTLSAIYERNELALRDKEGLERYKGFAYGEGDGIVYITENGIKYKVDYINGQKTGFFLDQKYNRQAVARIAKGKRVLDCFTHTGAFALNAAAAGAELVTAVDVSGEAIEKVKENAALNGLTERMQFLKADVFDLFTNWEETGDKYDLIILDPPAFTKSSSTVGKAIGGYREINRRAMKLLPRGGYLATCSCSHFMTDELFCKMLRSAAEEACVSLKQIERRTQSPDHPIMWNVPETDYLKFYIFQII